MDEQNLLDYINLKIQKCNASFMHYGPSDCKFTDLEITLLGDDDTITTLDEFGKTTYLRYKKSLVRARFHSDDDALDKVFEILSRLREKDIKLVSRPFSLEGLKEVTARQAFIWGIDKEYLKEIILL